MPPLIRPEDEKARTNFLDAKEVDRQEALARIQPHIDDLARNLVKDFRRRYEELGARAWGEVSIPEGGLVYESMPYSLTEIVSIHLRESISDLTQEDPSNIVVTVNHKSEYGGEGPCSYIVHLRLAQS